MLTCNHSTTESSSEKVRDTLLKQTLYYASPRVDFYIDSLRHEFSRDPRIQSSDPSSIHKLVATATKPSEDMRLWNDDLWRDYDFTTAKAEAYDQKCASNKTERLSCKAHEESDVGIRQDPASLFQKVLDFCKVSNPPVENLIEVIKLALILQTDVRNRAAFQGCFVRHFGLAFGTAARARRALLFLCRFYAAVLAFTDAAARLPSFQNISFKFGKSLREVLPSKSGTQQMTMVDILAGLSIPSSEALIAKLCRSKSKTMMQVDKDFDKARRQPCHIHAEMQLVDDFENQPQETSWRTHPYIGSSKLCCFLCDSFLRHHGFFQYRGSHWKIYYKWQVPQAFQTAKTAIAFRDSLRLVYREVVEHVRRLMTGEAQPMKDPLRAESTVDLSTAATVATREVAEMTLPSPSTRWTGNG